MLLMGLPNMMEKQVISRMIVGQISIVAINMVGTISFAMQF